MTVTPELEVSPPTETTAPVAPDRPAPLRPDPSDPRWSVMPWVRLVLLLVVAALTQVVYVFIWPLSYFMTQAPDFTYEYLVQYPAAWQRLSMLLARFEQFWPGASRSLDFLVDALMQAFIGAFILYLVAIFLVRRGLPPVLGVVAVVAPPLAYHATLFAMPG